MFARDSLLVQFKITGLPNKNSSVYLLQSGIDIFTWHISTLHIHSLFLQPTHTHNSDTSTAKERGCVCVCVFVYLCGYIDGHLVVIAGQLWRWRH